MDFDELVWKGKVKRVFRAKRKIIIPDIVSHITQRAAGKEPLFLEDNDYFFMLAQLNTDFRAVLIQPVNPGPQGRVRFHWLCR